MSDLAQAAYAARDAVVDTINRENRIARWVAEASRYTVSWDERTGRLDYRRRPVIPARFLGERQPRAAEKEVDDAFDRVAVVLKEVRTAGLAWSAERLMQPVIAEAMKIGVTRWLTLDTYRFQLGAASARTEQEKGFVEYLKRKFDETGYDEPGDQRVLLEPCREAARELDSQALGNIFTRHRINVICRYLRRRQGGGWTTRFAMAFAK
ncbi:hypothetical protein [Amycolatopsis rubida]|uniref:hypothetical protein n=1 Tax=Amycolatopsis rubida TaxID=112413 RepID=UPI00116036EE|nr:hypothetical protein [Amycolatopsis rubida]